MNQQVTVPMNAATGGTRNQRAAMRIVASSFKFPTHAGFRDLTHGRFGRLVAQRYACSSIKSRVTRHYWICTCDCGEWAVVESTALSTGRTTSCGCRQKEATISRNVEMATHGDSGSIEYRTWTRMKARCQNKNYPKFQMYGGRGVTVCDRWSSSFEAFLEDMGRRPANKTSIDRIDGSKGYEPGNCRWADYFEQNNNRTFKQ